MADYIVDLVEEPSPAEDWIGRQRIAQHVQIPMMADESAPTLHDAARALTSGSARALSIKITHTGFSESAKLVSLASALGARTLIGSQADSMLEAAAALAFGFALLQLAREPGELDYFHVIEDHILVDPLEVQDGHLVQSRSRTGIPQKTAPRSHICPWRGELAPVSRIGLHHHCGGEQVAFRLEAEITVGLYAMSLAFGVEGFVAAS
jgi:L-Ala-D/L-Glu epimerase